MTKVRVWLSHDGYRDPDDNLALLVGAAKARTVAKSDADISVAGVVFGDTTDGAQYHMVNPTRNTPGNMDGDARFDDIAKNKVAAGNYAFFKQYAVPALKQLAPGWTVIDTIKGEVERSWNYDAKALSGISYAARELVSDIKAAIGKGGGSNPKEVVVYSAGGGAHVPAEAIGYLRNTGVGDAKIKDHFAIVQHGRTNFTLNLEPEARAITRTFTIPIAKQDLDTYANGMSGPGLGKLARGGVFLEGDRFGTKMATALDVAQGLKAFGALGSNKTFKATTDGSDAGSHAFAVSDKALLANWNNRLKAGESLSSQAGHEHQVVKADGGYRLRVMFDGFDWKDVRALMNGSRTAAATASAASDTADERQTGGAVAAAALAPETAPAASHDPSGRAGDALTAGESDVFAFHSEGEHRQSGLDERGAHDTIDREPVGSENVRIDLGETTDAVAIVLAGLETVNGLHEAATISFYTAEGRLVETRVVDENGRTDIALSDEARYAGIEAAAWQGADPDLSSEAPPDFSLVWIGAA